MRAYVDLLQHGAARRLVAATATGKLGFAVFPLATVLLGHGSSGSFLDAGAVAGAWSMGGTVTGPLRGRLVDRYSQRLPLVALTVITALAAAGLATAAGTTRISACGHCSRAPVVLRQAMTEEIEASSRTVEYFRRRTERILAAQYGDSAVAIWGQCGGDAVAGVVPTPIRGGDPVSDTLLTGQSLGVRD